MTNNDPISVLRNIETRINSKLDVIECDVGTVIDDCIPKKCIRFTLDKLESSDIIQKLEKIKKVKISECYYKYGPEIRMTVIYYFL